MLFLEEIIRVSEGGREGGREEGRKEGGREGGIVTYSEILGYNYFYIFL